jgi:hypothetical protein
MGDHQIQHLTSVAIDYRNGIFAGTNNVVRALTGRDPLTVAAFVELNRRYFDERANQNSSSVSTTERVGRIGNLAEH